MPRPKGTKNKSYSSRFKSYEGRKPKDRHIRLTHDMLMDKKCLQLSASAFRLYTYIKLWAGGQNEVKYSMSMAKPLMSAPTFEKAKKELISAGFIEQPNLHSAKYKCETAVFEFTDKWNKE